METEENRRGLLQGQGLEGSGGGAPGPGGGVLGKYERFTGLAETPPQVGVFQVASRSPRVPSPIHSFSRQLDTSFMLMSASGAGAAETGPRSGPRDLPAAVSIHLPQRSPHTWGRGHGYSVARPLPVLYRRKASGESVLWPLPLLPDVVGQPRAKAPPDAHRAATHHSPRMVLPRATAPSHPSSPSTRERASRRAQAAWPARGSCGA